MGHCSCGAHSCAAEKKVDAKVSVFHEYGKVIFSLLLLTSGIIMNALDLAFFREGSVALIWYIVAYLPVGIPVMKEAWESIREKDYFSEFTLMIIATLGAFYIGEYPEGVAVMLFYTVGELFQDKAVDKAKRNIGALLDVRPEKALVLREGNLVIESPKKIKVGEIIEIKAGAANEAAGGDGVTVLDHQGRFLSGNDTYFFHAVNSSFVRNFLSDGYGV